MIEQKVKLQIMDKEIEVTAGTSFEELAKLYQNHFQYPIIMVKEDYLYRNLSDTVDKDAKISFYDMTDRDANRVYFNGLIYLTIYSVKKLFGDTTEVMVRHSIDKGLYIELSRQITRESVAKIEDMMREISKANLRIIKSNVRRLEAIDYFNKIGYPSKAGVLKYNTNSYVTLYKLGDMYDFYFSEMPVSTGQIDRFELEYLNSRGFVLMYPTTYNPDKIRKYVHHPQLFDVFKEHHEWAKIMKVSNVTDLNSLISNGIAGSLIRIDETIQSNRLLNISREIYNHKDRIKVILIAGPSSSGKTTTSLKLSNYLRSFGMVPKKISMDDYFVSRKDNPKKEDGSYDYECLEAINLDLFNENIAKLLKGEKIIAPTYNFVKGEPEFINEMVMFDDEILIIEGIHALNPKILSSVNRNKKFKIYISPATGINIDEHNRISTSDNRMLRRIVRDNKTRGNTVDTTMTMWPSVREGEEKYIFPYQDEANATFNTALLYELSVLKVYVEPLLYSVNPRSENYEEARRLINMLRTFLPLPADEIPDDSIIREFIGESCFKVD